LKTQERSSGVPIVRQLPTSFVFLRTGSRAMGKADGTWPPRCNTCRIESRASRTAPRQGGVRFTREGIEVMGRNSRFGVAAAAVLAFAPAWAADEHERGKDGADCQSYSQHVDAVEARLARLEARLANVHEGSGAGEPARAAVDPYDPRREADQRFLNEIWTAP
jgi:hypothetical protein